MSFGRGSGSDTYDGPKETKVGKVTNIKPSATDRGKMRVNMVGKTGSRQPFAIEVDAKLTKGLERKKVYEAEVWEKPDESGARGGMQRRSTALGTRTYMCDEAPSEYTNKHKPQFTSFGGSDKGGTSSRLKF